MAELRVPNDQFLSPNKSRLPDVIVVPDSSTTLDPRHIHQHLTPPSPHLAYSSSTSPSPTSPTPSIPSNVLLSPDNIDTLTRRSNSTVSSIFDLSFESDQLERALKENDVNAVTKFLHIHHGKFPLKPSHAFSTGIGGRHYDISASSGSRRPSSRSHDLDMPFRRFTLERIDFDRRESVTPEWDIPDIFRSSIHVAISNNSLDVILVLLKSGIDPNEPSINLINYDSSRGYGHHDTDRRHQPEIVPEETDELSNVQVTSGNGLEVPVFHHSPHHTRLDVSKTKFHYLHVTPPDKHHMTLNEHGGLSKIITYSSEDLLKLPPLYIAVVEKKAMVIDLLLMYGAEATVQDRNGSTPLHLAASPEHFDVECCKALLRYGAKIKVKHHNGVSPYDQRPELAELQISEVQNVLSGKCTAFSLDRLQGTSKSGGKRISLSSNSDSNSRSFGRTGSLKRLFKREKGNSEGKEKDKKRTRCESTTTEYNLDLKDYGSSASSHRSSRSRLHSTAVTEADENEVILVSTFFSFELIVHFTMFFAKLIWIGYIESSEAVT
ncbi:hypothetical protein ACJMK2_006661 [Sinanodonta woodiana]|uniref:Uncharacterized protein n=1 Tax=Sinanodonta woodiana TaxID=1069815 RepID=A0ABD3VWM8_SINWO